MTLHESPGTLLSAAALLAVTGCGGPPATATEPAAPADSGDADGQPAEEPSASRVPDVLIAFAPCTDDYRSLCADVDPDDGAAVIACLRDHDTVLGRHCLSALDPEAPEVRSSRCVAAVAQMCPDADDPESRTECIRRFDQLEPVCQRPDTSPGAQQQGPGASPAGRGMGGGVGRGRRPY